MATAEGRAFTWDDVINNESTFTLVDEGDYTFRVIKMTRERHPGSAKLPACPKATLTLAITDDAGNELTSLQHSLFMYSTVEGLISAFFLSVGLKKHGEPVSLAQFNNVVGRTGRCHVFVDTWTNDKGEEKKNNKIKYFIDAFPDRSAPVQGMPIQGGMPVQGVPAQPPMQSDPVRQNAPQQTFGGWGNAQPGTGWTSR